MHPRSAIASVLLALISVQAFAQSPGDYIRKHYETAEALRRAGNLAGAESEFNAILAETYHRLGRVYLAEADRRSAVAALESAAAYQPDAPDVLVDLAIAYFQTEQYQKAFDPLGKVLARDPRSVAAHHMRGKSHFMLGEFEKAAAELETALKLSPKDPDIIYTLGLAYLKMKQEPKARAVYDRMVAQLGDRAALRVVLGRAYRETGFLDEAIAEFKKAVALDARFPRVHYYLGLTYLLKDGQTRIPDAEREFQVELAAHPDEYFANYYLGILSVIDRKWDAAVGYLEKAVKAKPDDPDPYFHLGQAYQGLGKQDLAIAALEKTIALTSDVSHNEFQVGTAHYRLGQSLLKVGRTDEAQKELKIAADLKSKSVKRDEQRAEAYLTSASLQEQRSNLPDSIASEGVGAGSIKPDAPTSETARRTADYFVKVIAAAHNNIGLLRAERQDFRAAAEQFGLAAKWNPSQEGLSFNLGLANFKVEKYKEAVAPLESELKAHPDNIAAKRLLGMSYFMTNDYPRASELLAEVVAVRPDTTLHYPLALALAKQGKVEESNRIIQQMVAMGANSPEVHILLGQAHSEQGDTAKAIEELQAAIALDRNVRFAHFYLGMIHIKAGKFGEAVREFESELATNPSDLEAKYHLGYAQLAAQDTARGIKTLREVVHARPEYADARYELGKALFQQGDVKAAIENLEVAAKLDPEKPHVHYQLGRAYIAAGRQAEGESRLETAKKLRDQARTQTSQ
jgi:tetratricopeptide (TPR) repeat protein